ncbi:MAG TPA: TolC family protein [Burkholderiales bacterium]|nr:TolC family protein [Burkholderiales bacterium]
MFYKISPLIILTGLITSCSLVAPNRPDPSVKLPSSWNYQSNPAESNLPYIAWWQKFNDPNLNQIIESALKNNDSLEASKANIEHARASLLSVEMSWIPSLSALTGFFNLQPLMPQPQLIYGMYAGYNSLNIFNIIAQQKAAELGVEAAKMQYQGSKLDVIAQTASAYYTLIAQKEELRLNQENLNDLTKSMQIKQNNRRAGLTATDATTNATQSYYQTLSQVKAIQNNIIKCQNALNYLLGDMPGTEYPTADFAKIETSYTNISSLPAKVIGNRPDVAVAALEYKIYAQDVTATYTQLLPSFMLGLGPAGGTNGGIANMPSSFSSTIQMNFINWSLNPAVFGQASSYKGQAKAAYVNYIDTVHKALRDINNDLATNQITNERYQLLKQAGNSAASKYKDTYSAYQAGLKSFDDTLNAKQNLNQVQQSINQIRLAQMQAIISLYQDLGGGYRYFDESREHN